MATNKLIDLDLLTTYDTKIKEYIDNHISTGSGIEVYANYSLLPNTDVEDKTIAYCEEDYTDIDTSTEYTKGFYEYKDGTGWIIISTSSSESGLENLIESISVNGATQSIVNKNVDITVPTKTSDLTNDSGFITSSDIPTELPANGGNSNTVNNHTVNADVPANAEFTDTVYTHPSTHAASMITGLHTCATTGNAATADTLSVARTITLSGQINGSVSFDGSSDITISTSEGEGTQASGVCSHAEGGFSKAIGDYSHAEGHYNDAKGYSSHAEGNSTEAISNCSHAEGYNTVANGNYSHAEGSTTEAIGRCSHAEGSETVASGDYSHAEGRLAVASGDYSHAEGYKTVASGSYSHAEGCDTTASGRYSHAEGRNTTAESYLVHVQGQYNKLNDGTQGSYSATNNAFVIGNGSSTDTKSNAFRVTFDGKTYGLSAFNSTGADYAEYFEWVDGNLNNEDRIGYFVTLENDKIRLANSSDDFILGIISANSSVIGNSEEDAWKDMYMRDKYGRLIYEDIEVEAEYEEIKDLNADGEEEIKTIVKREAGVERHIKLNPDYDPNRVYAPRSVRQEWDVVGMLGQIIVNDDGTCQVNGYCKCNNDSIATASDTGYRVMKRIDEKTILILFK